MKNIRLKLDQDDFRPAFVLDDVKGIDLQEITLPPAYQADQIIVRDSKDVRLMDSGQLRPGTAR